MGLHSWPSQTELLPWAVNGLYKNYFYEKIFLLLLFRFIYIYANTMLTIILLCFSLISCFLFSFFFNPLLLRWRCWRCLSSYGASYDLAARRKNATRESTATLKAWLHEHMKNPYPTKGEKIMLAIITKMTLTQVSTWFANARRRLKKENKMTWEPKNRTEDEDACLSDDEKEQQQQSHEQPSHQDDKRTTIAATPTEMAATMQQQTAPLMPSVKRLDYDAQHNLNATGGGSSVNGGAASLSLNHSAASNSVNSSIGGGGIAGSQGVGVATDLIGSHHHALAGGLNTQAKGKQH